MLTYVTADEALKNQRLVGKVKYRPPPTPPFICWACGWKKYTNANSSW
jgi:hypothetical protein